ncbi:MAG: colicin uptake protein TolR [Arsenophonus sp.]
MSCIQHKRELKSEINIIPLLDVLLVLLLIFIATAPIVSQSIKVELPSSSQSGILTDNYSSPIILEVFGDEKYTIIIDGHREEFLQQKEIEWITKKIFIKYPQSFFLIGGDKDVPYKEVIKALNILHQSGIKSIGFMTKPI